MKVFALKSFVCPIDGLPLLQEKNIFRCEKGHVFDAAREGYCNLLLVQQKASLDPGDNKEMVASRRKFLDDGHFASIAERVFDMVCNMAAKVKHEAPLRMVDAGCGEGYYLHQLNKLAFASHHKTTLALAGCDISKWAIKAAAKRSADIAWVVAGNRQLPFAPGTVDLILSMFGFPDWESFKTVQPVDGRVLLISPGPDHLIELRKIIYPEINVRKDRSLNTATECGYMLKLSDQLKFSVNLENNASIQNLLAMTPHAFRIAPKAQGELKALKRLTISIDVLFRVLQSGR